MTESIKYDAIIVGAGLTGLTTAFYLKRAGKKVLVLEKNAQTGGVINSVEKEGFLYETGPNTGVLGSGEMVELFEHLGDKVELAIANPDAKKRFVLKDNQWVTLPSGLLGGIKTPLFTWKDKIRILGEPWREKGDDPMESLADLVIRRMGESYLNYAVDPFVSGIYSGDPYHLVTKYALPKLYNLEQNYGSFIGGALKKKGEPKSDIDKKATREVFTAKGGLRNLISALTEAIGEENIILSVEDIQITPLVEGFEIVWQNESETEKITSKNVVTTTGAYALPDILPFLYPNVLETLSNLRYAKVRQVITGFKNWNGIPLNAFGGLVPYVEGKDFLGVLFNSTLFPDRAPKEGAVFSIFVGGIRKPELVDMPLPELMHLINTDLCKVMGVEEFKPDLLEDYAYQKAIPQYEASSKERLENIEKVEQQYPGLYLAGNIRDGIGMSDRVKQGRGIAEAIAKEKA